MSTPMLMLVMAAYFLSLLVVLPDPSSTTSRIISVLPPIAPLAMPARAASGVVEAWEVGVAVILMLAAIAAAIVVAGRIYSHALLRTGARVPLRQALTGSASPRAREG